MIIAGLLAGGKGTRMNLKTPKQFLKLGGIPIIIKTIEKFSPYVDKIVVATNVEYINKTRLLLKKYKLENNKIILVPGGETRFKSVINVIQKAYEIDKGSVVITHDVARPFVSKKIIKDNLLEIKKYDAITTSIPTIDTIVVMDNGLEKEVPNRDYLYLDQGPQTVRAKQFIEILKKTNADICIEIGKLYLLNKLKVKIVPGERINFKITNKIDFEFAEYLIKGDKKL